MKRSILLSAVLIMGCGGDKPPPPVSDPAAEKKLDDELKAQRQDAGKRKIKEGIPPAED